MWRSFSDSYQRSVVSCVVVELQIRKNISMRLKHLPMSKREYQALLDLQVKRRSDWPAVFSVNKDEKVWPWVCYGPTPEEERQYAPLADHPRLREIAQNFISNVDEKGGRFFINQTGVFGIKGENEFPGITREQFIDWVPDGPLPQGQKVSTVPIESLEEQRVEHEEIWRRVRVNRAARRKRT